MEENYTFRDPSISFSDSRSPLTADVVVPSLQLALEYPVSSLRSPPFTTRLSLPLPASLFRLTKKNNDLSSYQGDQHYDSNEFFGDTIVRQANDAEKKQNLERIGYPLVYLFFFSSILYSSYLSFLPFRENNNWFKRYTFVQVSPWWDRQFPSLEAIVSFKFAIYYLFVFSFILYFLISNFCSFPSPSSSLSLSFSFFELPEIRKQRPDIEFITHIKAT